MSDFRTTITTGGSAQIVTARASGSFSKWQVRNESTGDLYVSDYQTASASVGLLVKPGEAYTEESPIGGALSVWGATTGQQFSARVW